MQEKGALASHVLIFFPSYKQNRQFLVSLIRLCVLSDWDEIGLKLTRRLVNQRHRKIPQMPRSTPQTVS